jgi:hypothetical protein
MKLAEATMLRALGTMEQKDIIIQRLKLLNITAIMAASYGQLGGIDDAIDILESIVTEVKSKREDQSTEWVWIFHALAQLYEIKCELPAVRAQYRQLFYAIEKIGWNNVVNAEDYIYDYTALLLRVLNISPNEIGFA